MCVGLSTAPPAKSVRQRVPVIDFVDFVKQNPTNLTPGLAVVTFLPGVRQVLVLFCVADKRV